MMPKRKIKKMLYGTLTILALLAVVVLIFINQTQFGRLSKGERLERIKQSPNYRNGSFKNKSNTPNLADGVSYFTVLKEFIFKKSKRTIPTDTLPSQKTDLLHLDKNEDLMVWFGHSSYFVQIDQKRILVDPVLSGSASPLPWGTKAFITQNTYTAADIPEIDYLFISHDHWDHLDYKTIKALQSKIKKIICGLGVGAHFEYWGFDKNQIIEEDWDTTIALDSGFVAYTTPARHFSGRGLKANQSLWTSYVLQTPTFKLFIGGDSGYDTHFAEIGKQFGPIDLAIVEQGQYDEKWKYIHLLPNEFLKVAQELNAKRIFPVHNSKFALGNHDWDEPLIKIADGNKQLNLPVITPMIGERVNLKDSTQTFSKWWIGLN